MTLPAGTRPAGVGTRPAGHPPGRPFYAATRSSIRSAWDGGLGRRSTVRAMRAAAARSAALRVRPSA
ncbi:hypothetical protein [Actinomadura sp. 3N407]|uniref:hypothetical protein n=1 Tax=Actinomadura sp. 3N407 TaxID=3457423 RepID=UPI003FCE0683